MPNLLMPSVISLVAAGAYIAGATAGVTAQVPAESSRTVYVTATGKNGDAVTDLRAAEFELKVGGRKLEVVTAEPAREPMRIALVVSDAGSGGFQGGLTHFIQKLTGRAEFALISLVVQPEIIVDYSSESSILRDGLRRLGARGLQRGAQLLETINDVTKYVRREGTRPVIVVIRVGGEATTAVSGKVVRDQLRKSGAIMYVISTVGAQRAAPSHAREGISQEQAQLHDDESIESALNLGMVLGDGVRESGGRHVQVLSTTLIPTVDQLADELLNQFVLTFVLPNGVKPTDRLSVSSKRKGVTVRAPARLP